MDHFRFLNCMYIKLQKDKLSKQKITEGQYCPRKIASFTGLQICPPSIKDTLPSKCSTHFYLISLYPCSYLYKFFFKLLKTVYLNYDISVTAMIRLIEPSIVSMLQSYLYCFLPFLLLLKMIYLNHDISVIVMIRQLKSHPLPVSILL